MLIEMTFTFLTLLALTGLSIDGARWWQAHGNAQYVATSAAMAAAAQLDGKSGAISRAMTAAQNIAASNVALFDGATTVAPVAVQICASLPCTAASDTNAAYAIVTQGAAAAPLFIEPVAALPVSATATAASPIQIVAGN